MSIIPGDPGHTTATDGSLLRRYQGGVAPAADALYHRYARRVLAVARGRLSQGLAQRVDAEDIVQSVFRRFFRAARDGRYAMPAGEELWSLLVAVTLNRLRSEETHHRASKRDLRRTAILVEGTDVAGNGAVALAELELDEALDRLPPHHAEVARLRMAGHEVAEIAEQTGRSKRTVERILQETRQRLRACLEA